MIFQIIMLSGLTAGKIPSKHYFMLHAAAYCFHCVQHLLQSLIPIIDPRVLFVRVETEEFRQSPLIVTVVPLIDIVVDRFKFNFSCLGTFL